jgi:anti-sigma B factor antagonist
MSTLIDELRANPAGTRTGPGALSRRPAPLAGRGPFRRPLALDETYLGRATTCLTSMCRGGGATQSGIRATAPLGRSQILLLVGELDAATAVLARRQLRDALERGRGPLVLDCSSVRFIDAAWLGVLVSTARYARQLGRKVTVAAPSPRVLRVLRFVGLEWLTGDE